MITTTTIRCDRCEKDITQQMRYRLSCIQTQVPNPNTIDAGAKDICSDCQKQYRNFMFGEAIRGIST